MVPGGFACVVDCWCGAVDSRKHLARPRTSASGGRQGAWWHDAATQADARMQAGADVPAESAKRCAGGLCMWHCIELRSGGRKRLRGVRGVHGSCCGATNGGCDGFGVSLVETPGSAGCTSGRVARCPDGQRPRAALFPKRASPCCQRYRVSGRYGSQAHLHFPPRGQKSFCSFVFT